MPTEWKPYMRVFENVVEIWPEFSKKYRTSGDNIPYLPCFDVLWDESGAKALGMSRSLFACMLITIRKRGKIPMKKGEKCRQSNVHKSWVSERWICKYRHRGVSADSAAYTKMTDDFYQEFCETFGHIPKNRFWRILIGCRKTKGNMKIPASQDGMQLF